VPFRHKWLRKVRHWMCFWHRLLPQLLNLNLLFHLQNNTYHCMDSCIKINIYLSAILRWTAYTFSCFSFASFTSSMKLARSATCRTEDSRCIAMSAARRRRRRRACIAMYNLLGDQTWRDRRHGRRCAARGRSVLWVLWLEVSLGTACTRIREKKKECTEPVI
jgi:hypothetical protein